MKTSNKTMTTLLVSLTVSAAAFASDATTSATAGSNSFLRNGTADATASYDGRFGFARTQANSGSVNSARGVAVGVDRDGVSLSVSNAVATRFGPAVATNFNVTIGRDGQVARSGGISVAEGPLRRSATAGGTSGVTAGVPHATATATGDSDRFGRVRANSYAKTTRATPQRIVRHGHTARRVYVRR